MKPVSFSLLTWVAKALMAASFLFYGGLVSGFWLTAIMGMHNDIWSVYDLPQQASPAPLWTLVSGLAGTIIAFSGLGAAYLAIWRILDGGEELNFRIMARHLRRLSYGMIVFWVGYQFVNGILPYILAATADVSDSLNSPFDPLDTEAIYIVLPVAILAISRALRRAWLAEEEVQSFL